MIPVRGYTDKTVAVLGLGRSGVAACKALVAGGARVLAWDDHADTRAAAEGMGIALTDISKPDAMGGAVTLITSPGIPHLYPKPHPIIALAQAQGLTIDNDVGLFFRSYATPDWDRFDVIPRVVAVTGSNGKSTTTALIEHILRSSGRPVQMGGNIGRGVLDLEPAHDGEIVVLELSSYQIELARALSPDIAIFLNISPDHLDRHGGMGGYFAAKARLFTQGGPDRAIIGVDEPEGRFLAGKLREEIAHGDPVMRISATQAIKDGWSVCARKGFLAEWRRGRQIASIDLRQMSNLPGTHNHQNACAAYAACRTIGLGAKEIEAAMGSFAGLKHRCQIIAQIDGVRYVNDSKATNADASAQALSAFKNIRWIAGGVPKEGGIGSLAPLFERISKTYLIGEAAADFAQALGETPHVIAQTLEAAVAQAHRDADAGDVVLLSPACASFDQFDSFEARGDAFEALVEAL